MAESTTATTCAVALAAGVATLVTDIPLLVPFVDNQWRCHFDPLTRRFTGDGSRQPKAPFVALLPIALKRTRALVIEEFDELIDVVIYVAQPRRRIYQNPIT